MNDIFVSQGTWNKNINKLRPILDRIADPQEHSEPFKLKQAEMRVRHNVKIVG